MPDDAQRAAVQSFGDFERIKTDCCEIRRSLPFDFAPLTMGLHIAIAVMAGFAALWAVNVQHDNLTGVMRQLIPIAVLACLFLVVRRASSKRRANRERASVVFAVPSETFLPSRGLMSDIRDAPFTNIRGFDEEGRTPVERVFKS